MKTKQNILIAILLVLIVIVISYYEMKDIKNSVQYETNIEILKNELKNIEKRESKFITTNKIFEIGCIKDEKTAKKTATIIFESVYEDSFNESDLPLTVRFNENDQTWVVETSFPEHIKSDVDTTYIRTGGTKTLILRKSNAEVVEIWATK